MTKDELIFDWRNTDSHAGRKLAALAVVVVIFLIFLSVIKLRFDTPGVGSVKSASVLLFSDDSTGSSWRQKAEEDGPFPGRLEIREPDSAPSLNAISGWDGRDSWNDYEVGMRPMQSNIGESVDRIASKGLRFFPSRKASVEAIRSEARPAVSDVMFPVLIPYSKEALVWLPKTLPAFKLPGEDSVLSTSWRFVLSLRRDGSVAQCLSLSGGDDAALIAMVGWLEGLRFAKSDEESRWMGLRVEFLNERSHGTDTE